MASAITNVVFRSIEDKWRGPFPCTGPEIMSGFVAGLLITLPTTLLVGGIASFFMVAGLVVWRRLDQDRSDYVTTFVRRHFTRVRAYNGHAPDRAFEAFEPR
jgi:hypothetical protein